MGRRGSGMPFTIRKPRLSPRQAGNLVVLVLILAGLGWCGQKLGCVPEKKPAAQTAVESRSPPTARPARLPAEDPAQPIPAVTTAPATVKSPPACCRYCGASRKPCGDWCVAPDAECRRKTGCACARD
jgi:hypothetical protein